MSKIKTTTETVALNKVLLDLKNLRIKGSAVKIEKEAIEHLCNNEKVYELAKDIVTMEGLSPMETLGVIANEPQKKDTFYTVMEGNRRICALKLLHDSDLAPQKYQARFESLAEKLPTPIDEINITIFSNRKDAEEWLLRIHNGENEGVGRREWSAVQKGLLNTKTGTSNPNEIATKVLDYAVKNQLISKSDRDSLPISTIQRFVSKTATRENFGIHFSKGKDLKIDRELNDFNTIVKMFLDDAVESEKEKEKENKKIHSRMNAPQIKPYVHDLINRSGVSNERLDAPVKLNSSKNEQTTKTSGGRSRPIQPKTKTKLHHDTETKNLLQKLGNFKLQHMYYELTSLPLLKDSSQKNEFPIAVGVMQWCFLECLTRAAGRKEGNPFNTYLNQNNLDKWGFTDKDTRKRCGKAGEEILAYGNEAKHDKLAALYDSNQLHKNWDTLQPVIKKLVELAIEKKAGQN